MMMWHFYWQEALSNLFLAKLRSLLAILGVLVGTCAVVSLVTIGEMAKYKALAEFKSLGMDIASLTVNQSIDFNSGVDWVHAFTPDYTFSQQIESVSSASHAIIAIAPVANLFLPVYYKGHKLEAEVLASNTTFPLVAKINLAAGRFLTRFDRNNDYCVIGSALANQIHGLGSPNFLGKEIQVGSAFFTIIGTAQPWIGNELIMNNVDHSVMISLAQAHRIAPSLYVSNTLLKLRPDSDPTTLESQIRAYFSKQFPQVSVDVHTGKQLIESMTHQKNIFTWTLALIGCIALFVSGIGIMNVMLVSVSERKREIGIRLAIGAKQRDITMMFLCEAVILSVSGGVLGVVVALILSGAVANFLHWPLIFSLMATTSGLFVSVLTGIFFGYYPAYKAAHLNPIDVLRAE